jgi:hypothetical protein
MHKHITHNRCHKTFADFREAILAVAYPAVSGCSMGSGSTALKARLTPATW